jgi:predicted transcriptional regulator
MPVSPELSKKLLDLKKQCGLTFEQIGEEVGSSAANVRRYITGETKVPDSGLLVSIVNVMGGDPAILSEKSSAPKVDADLVLYEKMKADFDKQLSLWHARQDREIEHLKQVTEQTIRNKDEWIHRLKDELQQQKRNHKRMVVILVVLIALLAVFSAVYLLRDIADPSWGYIRY